MSSEVISALSQMTVFFLVTAVGYLSARLGYLDEYTRVKITKLLLNITLPCMILGAAGSSQSDHIGQLAIMVLVLGGLQLLIELGYGIIFNGVMRTPQRQRPIYILMSVCSNTGFLGIPVAAAILGDQAILLGSLFIMALNLLFFSIGLATVDMSARHAGFMSTTPDQIGNSNMLSKKKLAFEAIKSSLNPTFFAALLAIILVLSHVELPRLAEDTIQMIGGLTSPLAMLIVGQIIAQMKWDDLKGNARLAPFIVGRQMLLPLIGIICFIPFNVDPVVVGLFAVMFAMPIGSMTSLFAEQSKLPPTLPAVGTVVSTLVSFAVVPIVVVCMEVLS